MNYVQAILSYQLVCPTILLSFGFPSILNCMGCAHLFSLNTVLLPSPLYCFVISMILFLLLTYITVGNGSLFYDGELSRLLQFLHKRTSCVLLRSSPDVFWNKTNVSFTLSLFSVSDGRDAVRRSGGTDGAVQHGSESFLRTLRAGMTARYGDTRAICVRLVLPCSGPIGGQPSSPPGDVVIVCGDPER